ncbi:MAG: hypothetical protein AB9873_08125 [Syntrophobacteraceae bacterium]
MGLKIVRILPVLLAVGLAVTAELCFHDLMGDVQTPAVVYADESKNESGKTAGKDRDKNQKQDEYYREMDQLDAEKNRKLDKIDDEYKREREKAEEEYQRDINTVPGPDAWTQV